MRALLVHPEFPMTFWGMQHALPLAGYRAALPPLGLITLGALLPPDWELRLVDLNIEDLSDADLAWAEVVLVGGMHIQAPSMHEVLARCRAAGRRSVVGGPAPTTAPGEFGDADLIFQGEAEGRIDSLLAALRSGSSAPRLLAPSPEERPRLETSPVPRFDLLDLTAYSSAAIQYSRGCPFRCEFCDIIEMFGRVPRLKQPAQIIAELEALHHLGFRRPVFFVDDNFIGNRVAVRGLLPHVAAWQAAHGYPFELYTEASVNLAADEPLVDAMAAAGFAAVFLGIETPSKAALHAAHKSQNAAVDLSVAVERLTSAGLEVMGGFIVGFDQDDPRVFAEQRAFISSVPVPLAMVGLLNALPGTALWRRLAGEGRLRSRSTGDTFTRPNFEPAMPERALLEGYARLLADLYTPDAYYARCAAYIDRVPSRPGRKRVSARDLRTLLRAMWCLGARSPRRWHFWRLLLRALRRPHTFAWAVGHAIQGEHMIRYAQEEVLPRIGEALAQVRAESREAPAEEAPEAALTGMVGCA